MAAEVDVEMTAAFGAGGGVACGVTFTMKQVEQQQPRHRRLIRCFAKMLLQQLHRKLDLAVRHVNLSLIEDAVIDLCRLFGR